MEENQCASILKSKYVWCEDKTAGYQFWTKLFETLNPDITVQSKKNNSELRKAVEECIEDDKAYYIFMDTPIDNPDALREAKRIKNITETKENVYMVKIHSFEHVLLSFDMLEEWVFAKEDELKNKRDRFLKARKIFLRMVTDGIDTSEREELFKLTKYDTAKNSEKVAASLIRDITKNTGFATTKNKLGECFVEDCCTMLGRQKDDICGLDDNRLDSKTKRKMLVEHSSLYDQFREVGLL